MNQQERIAHFVQSRAHSQVAQPYELTLQSRPTATVEQLAQGLIRDAEFRSLRLGAWLTTPDGELIAEGVAIALPPYSRPEFQIWVQAMQMAARMQHEEGQRRAGRLALGAVIAGTSAVVFASRSAA